MNSLNNVTETDSSFFFEFPTIFEYCSAQAYAKCLNESRQCFSKDNVFINNGDTFNGKYIINYFKNNTSIKEINDYSNNISDTTLSNKIKSSFDTTELHKIINKTQDRRTFIEEINIINSIGYLTKKQYKSFLDKSSYSKNIDDLKKFAKKCNKNDLSFKILTTLFHGHINKTQHHLYECEIIEKKDSLSKLMHCSIIIFDITNDSESELLQARMSFNYIYNELFKYTDQKINESKKNGIIKKFILISTVMTWVNEAGNHLINNEDEEVHLSLTEKNVLERLPIAKYRAIFEFEKLMLKLKISKIKDIFKTYIIGTGITYGHEENAFHDIFTNAWNNPKEMYVTKFNHTMPVFHVDELAKLVFIVSTYDIKDNYIMAIEQESYSLNNIIKLICDELCSSQLVLKEDSLIINKYKFNSFTWDLICSNITIDPMLDIIVPNYRTQRTPIIFNIKELTSEFIETNNLYSLKCIVSGQPTHISSNIAERLAQYYKVQLINVPNLMNNYLELLKNNKNELMLRMNNVYEKHTHIIQSLTKLDGSFEDDWLNENIYSLKDEMINENNQALETYNKELYMSENKIIKVPSEISSKIINLEHENYLQENTYDLNVQNKKDLVKIDKEISDIKYMIEKLNNKHKDYKNTLSRNNGQVDHYLLPLIKESLVSCHKQGYILEVLPLSIQQMEFIFNTNISYPNFIILQSCGTNIPIFCKDTSCSTVTNGSSIHLNYDTLIKNTESNSNRNKCKNFDTCIEYNVNFNNVDIQDKIENKAENTFMNNKIIVKNMVDYFTNKNKDIKILRMNIPLELAEETKLNELQFKVFIDTITKQVGRLPFEKDIYGRPKNEIKTAINKLNIMKKQWDNDIVESQEWEKKQEYRKCVKIHNFLTTDILPKLLKGMSPINNKEDPSLHFPKTNIK